MTDHEVFETRLRTALDRYVAGGPTEFDAFEFARSVASAEPRRQSRGIVFGWPRVALPQLFWIVLATALLLAALAASALLVASRPEPGPASWQQIQLPGELGGSSARMTDLVQTEDGYLAIGRWLYGQGHVWESRDGGAWGLVPTGDMFAAAQLNGLVRTEDGYVAVGVEGSPGLGRAAVWRSADGQTWRPAVSVAEADLAAIDDVAFADGRYVAVGTQVLPTGYFDAVPRVWLSDDGNQWELATDVPTVVGLATGFSAVAADDSGFVATGPARGLWSSPDGDVWTPVDITAQTNFGNWLTDLVVGADGQTVAAGGPAVVSVFDGREWTRHDLLGALDMSREVAQYKVMKLAATTSGYAALYVDLDAMNDAPAATLLWTSRDGTTWVRPEVDVSPSFAVAGLTDLPVLLSCGDELIASYYGNTWILPGDVVSQGE